MVHDVLGTLWLTIWLLLSLVCVSQAKLGEHTAGQQQASGVGSAVVVQSNLQQKEQLVQLAKCA